MRILGWNGIRLELTVEHNKPLSLSNVIVLPDSNGNRVRFSINKIVIEANSNNVYTTVRLNHKPDFPIKIFGEVDFE